jgi:hypothetical protein
VHSGFVVDGWTERGLAARAIGQFTETLLIPSNDPVTPEAHVSLRGAVAGVKGTIRPDFIDFGTVAVSSAVDRDCTLNATVPAGGSLPSTSSSGRSRRLACSATT